MIAKKPKATDYPPSGVNVQSMCQTQAVCQTQDAGHPILFYSNDFESEKILGVVRKCAPTLEIHPKETLSAQSSRMMHSKSSSGAILAAGDKQYEDFWNIIFCLDQLLWNSDLIQTEPSQLAMLFSLVEYCDHKLFPHLEAMGENVPVTPQRLLETNVLTHLLQWLFTTSTQRVHRGQTAKIEYRKIAEKRREEILSEANDAIRAAEALPPLPSMIVSGAIQGALEWSKRSRTSEKPPFSDSNISVEQ